ncbi:MAG: hypothetical protein ACI4BD_08185 [Paludibacteraceae bacterium]
MKSTHLHTCIFLALLLLHGGVVRAEAFSLRVRTSAENAYLPFTSVAPMLYGSERGTQENLSRRLMQTGSHLSDGRRIMQAGSPQSDNFFIMQTVSPQSENFFIMQTGSPLSDGLFIMQTVIPQSDNFFIMQTVSPQSDNFFMMEAFASSAAGTTAVRPEEMMPRTMGTVGFAGLSAAPMLMEDGTIYQQGENRPIQRARGAGTPPGDLTEEPPLPVGDSLLPLLLLAVAYACYKRRRGVKAGL